MMFNLFDNTSKIAPQPANWAVMNFVQAVKTNALQTQHSMAAFQEMPVNQAAEIDDQIAKGSVFAFSVSGGKDGNAAAIAAVAYLDKLGHTGPRVLTHADLGVVEWRDSLPSCQRLAEKLGLELMVVRRQAGDMMDRWEGRWRNNLQRYADLSCVKLILPWSTPSMRFCTSELKHFVVTSALKKRFPNQNIVSVVGVRRQESTARAKMPVWGIDKKLERRGFVGLFWNAIIDWPVEQVFKSITDFGLTVHEAYTKYNSSRVSCVFCIMSSAKDLIASVSCPDNHEVYRRMVDLEVTSSFSFQSGKWLADVAPNLLTAEQADRLHRAKHVASLRAEIEDTIPKHLLYTKGWPTSMPTAQEAQLLAEVRIRVAGLLNIDIGFTTPQAILERYAALLAQKAIKDAAKDKRSAKLTPPNEKVQQPEEEYFDA